MTMTPEDAAKLREPFPADLVGTRDGLDFVGHAAVTDRLLKVDPGWAWEFQATEPDGSPVIRYRDKVNKQGAPTGVRFATMWIRLTVCGVTRPAVGGSDVYWFTDDVEKLLISDAIKNGAMRFGVALDLWSKEDLLAVPTVDAAQVQQIAALFDQIEDETIRVEAKKAWAQSLPWPVKETPADKFDETYASAMDAVEKAAVPS